MRAEQALACGMRKRKQKASRRNAFGRGGRGLAGDVAAIGER